MQNRFARWGARAPRLWAYFALAGCFSLVSASADASARARSRHRSETGKQTASEPAPPAGPLFFVISTSKQHVSVYGSKGLYSRSPVSTGRPDHPTPHGIFSIIGKERYHRSNIYSGAPMPYMQRITWSGVAMHEGVLPGYPASHGCIRMPHDFARRLFGYTEGSERVVITRQDIVPAHFSHPRLPVPKFMAPPPPENIASAQSQMLHNAIVSSYLSGHGPESIAVPAKADTGAGQKLLNPIEFARSMKARAAKQAEGAAAALAPARSTVLARMKEVREAAIAVRKAQIALSNAKDRLESTSRQLNDASGDEDATKAAADLKAEAEVKVAQAEAALSAAERDKAEKEQDAAIAMKASRDAESTRKMAEEAVKSWNRRLAPISIFVSRKTQRLYIRQAHVRIFDVPVTIRDPEKPLGTHLYMAMQPEGEAQTGTPALRWLVLTIPDASTSTENESRRHRRRHRDDDEDEAPRAALPAASASEALNRIEVPAEVESKISEMLWAGSSLIVSDKAMSGETGEHTDFVILTR